jgi:hypothetical protein
VAIANQSLCSIKTMLGEWQGATFYFIKKQNTVEEMAIAV